MNAVLALENGTWYCGTAVGATGVARGEVVFNTSMTGYQEVLTDPSYAGQIVTMTCPQIGNYGVAAQDVESRGPQVAGFVVREASPIASNWRSTGTLSEYLTEHGVVAITNATSSTKAAAAATAHFHGRNTGATTLAGWGLCCSMRSTSATTTACSATPRRKARAPASPCSSSATMAWSLGSSDPSKYRSKSSFCSSFDAIW